MPRYYFIIEAPDQRHDDDIGKTLPNDDDALAHARTIIRK
jgi:hypothetical protein